MRKVLYIGIYIQEDGNIDRLALLASQSFVSISTRQTSFYFPGLTDNVLLPHVTYLHFALQSFKNCLCINCSTRCTTLYCKLTQSKQYEKQVYRDQNVGNDEWKRLLSNYTFQLSTDKSLTMHNKTHAILLNKTKNWRSLIGSVTVPRYFKLFLTVPLNIYLLLHVTIYKFQKNTQLLKKI